MPRQRVGDIEIYYEVHGAGPRTLVMIRGLGSNLLSWYEQIDELSRHYKCVVFDNRGAGRTDKPDAPYSIKQMADDTAGLMDALGIGRAALLGISMGGMIAQEFALHHQQKLSCLILGCTHFGGSGVVQSPPEIVAAVMAGTSATPQKRVRNLLGGAWRSRAMESDKLRGSESPENESDGERGATRCDACGSPMKLMGHCKYWCLKCGFLRTCNDVI